MSENAGIKPNLRDILELGGEKKRPLCFVGKKYGYTFRFCRFIFSRILNEAKVTKGNNQKYYPVEEIFSKSEIPTIGSGTTNDSSSIRIGRIRDLRKSKANNTIIGKAKRKAKLNGGPEFGNSIKIRIIIHGTGSHSDDRKSFKIEEDKTELLNIPLLPKKLSIKTKEKCVITQELCWTYRSLPEINWQEALYLDWIKEIISKMQINT